MMGACTRKNQITSGNMVFPASFCTRVRPRSPGAVHLIERATRLPETVLFQVNSFRAKGQSTSIR